MDDREIVGLYWDRDERAIPATAQKYGSYCASIAKNILGNWQDAEECINDAYLIAWNSMPPHRPEDLSAFLGKIVRNLSFNRYKHNTADKRGGDKVLMYIGTQVMIDGVSYEYCPEDVTSAFKLRFFRDELLWTNDNGEKWYSIEGESDLTFLIRKGKDGWHSLWRFSFVNENDVPKLSS